MRTNNIINSSLCLMGMLCVGTAFQSCSDDETVNNSPIEVADGFFISAVGDEAEYILLAEELETGELHIRNNIAELEQNGYTWIFNNNPSAAVGLIYNQGDPGVGLDYNIDANGNLNKVGSFQITTRFTSYGFFDKYALTSVGGQTLAGSTRDDGVTFNFIDLQTLSMTEKSISTYNITGNGEQATTSGIVDMGNGEFLTGLVLSQPREEGATGGSSTGTITYPDSVWVAALDANLNIKHIYRDNRISYSAGRYRSQYYSQIAKAEDGTVYVFSGSYDYNSTPTTRPCGALKINAGADAFDKDYYFNIEALSDGYRFRKVWHITGNYFLLEFYNHQGRVTAVTDPATQYAVVNMKQKSLNWVGGEMPSKDEIISTATTPMAFNGKMYFPITAGSSNPTIYIIDPTTATATKGASIVGASSIRAVGKLTK